ncbi:Motility protein B [Rosistilla ulvae]|uniref:Motility protein B n=1 Tax=Rosistilla ulvae TaxID=1930277 RepID=A0A517LTS6_9BACT|nr:flagellar motor protein MotB [Rosistilla ulvae]QDS86022.1 Motility protein B [Rosistilla ulvae]
MDDDGGGDDAAAIPEWVVTFGDMMSLLLTFFIMLVSLSEIKEEEKFQALVESMRQQFGHERSTESMSPGDAKPRDTAFEVLATMGRAKRLDSHNGGVKAKAPVGEEPTVRIIRPGRLTAVGTVVFFPEGEAELSDNGKAALDGIAEELKGKPQKIEIRGHTSARTAAKAVSIREPMNLAYSRSVRVYDYLVNHHGIDPRRCRIAAAADSEPMSVAADPAKQQQNPRVEVFLLDETVSDLIGTNVERQKNIIPESDSARQ